MDRVVFADDGCWIWTGALNGSRYGSIEVDGRLRRPHRLLYEFVVGVIPEGLELDHLCRVRHCVNPDHLEAVTRSENLRRSPLVASAARQRALARREWMQEIGGRGGRVKRRREDSSSTEGMRSS